MSLEQKQYNKLSPKKRKEIEQRRKDNTTLAKKIDEDKANQGKRILDRKRSRAMRLLTTYEGKPVWMDDMENEEGGK